MIQLLAIFALLMLGGGMVLAVTFGVGTRKPAGPPSPTMLWLRRMATGDRIDDPGHVRLRAALVLGGVFAAAAIWFLTGWPVGAAIAFIAVPGLPWLLSASGAEKRAIAKLGALEAWTRRIGDYVHNGLGLQAAIVASARTTTVPLIGSEVRNLAVRLQAGVDPAAALRAFADELDDYSCDEVVAPLILQLADAGDGLHNALVDIAHAIQEEITTRSTVDSERARARFTVKFLTVATGVVALFGAFNAGAAKVYGTAFGQILLAVLAAVYIALMLWIRSLSLPERRPRLLGGVPAGGGTP
ncbi:MAG: type II secretion system F family protein [Hamadaea sp.]|uniref:type II secretion system F family protein n=1 Tax=Hamadaea sp. TaxID=2024425 RepID=UPI001828EE51|nr:type II secretion system F family protein [Hamadaea sp.]NUR72218.1 type II secretion system F family protein [Hamadaea sp.]NUT22111.1 type II secretion system F family protein [Hamadaea sp.]